MDKAAGASRKITITNEGGSRLSGAEVERMLAEAEREAEKDTLERERVEARNKLEQVCYTLKNQVSCGDHFCGFYIEYPDNA